MPTSDLKFYTVGIAKTGTSSIAGIFSKYKTQHEYCFPTFSKLIIDYQTDKISKDSFTNKILMNISKDDLDFNASSFNHFFLDILADNFPNAQFIFTIRDCYSWFESLLNMIASNYTFCEEWAYKWTDFLFGLDRSYYKNVNLLQCGLENYIDKSLSYWTKSNKSIIQNLPKERSLTIKTDNISKDIYKLIDFTKIPVEKISFENTHSFKAPKRYNVLLNTDHYLLEEKFKQYCQPLMDEYFPNHSFENFIKQLNSNSKQT